MTLTEADVDQIEGDGERNFINWLCEKGPEDPFGIHRRELYARYLADKPEFIATDAERLVRDDGRLILEAMAAQQAPVPLYFSPFTGRSLADVMRQEDPHPQRFPQVFRQSTMPKNVTPLKVEPEDYPEQPA